MVGSSGDLASSSAGLFIPNGSESPQLNPTGMMINSSNGNGSKSGMHSQMAAALMNKRQQQATRNSQTPTPTNAMSRQPTGLSSWPQDLSTLGFLPLPNDPQPSTGNSQQQHAIAAAAAAAAVTTVQRNSTDISQFRGLQSISSGQQVIGAPIPAGIDGIQYHQAQFAGIATTPQQQHMSSNKKQSALGDIIINRHNVIQCPLPKCTQGFNDANTLKQHLNFDHLRDDQHSNPGSPLGGFNNMAQATSSVTDTLSNGGRGTSNEDRNRNAPHWVDPEMWSNWIAAANGQNDNITVAAMATAMGVTPGVVGPNSFLAQIPGGQPQLTPSAATATAAAAAVASSSGQQMHNQGYPHYQHPTDSELLRMFDSVTNTTSDQKN
ncbi:hypothetical protein J3B02_004008 [Coemansia erecta]|nr:hypothetical protein J3B02_004008 [Coemansia erecta]